MIFFDSCKALKNMRTSTCRNSFIFSQAGCCLYCAKPWLLAILESKESLQGKINSKKEKYFMSVIWSLPIQLEVN